MREGLAIDRQRASDEVAALDPIHAGREDDGRRRANRAIANTATSALFFGRGLGPTGFARLVSRRRLMAARTIRLRGFTVRRSLDSSLRRTAIRTDQDGGRRD